MIVYNYDDQECHLDHGGDAHSKTLAIAGPSSTSKTEKGLSAKTEEQWTTIVPLIHDNTDGVVGEPVEEGIPEAHGNLVCMQALKIKETTRDCCDPKDGPEVSWEEKGKHLGMCLENGATTDTYEETEWDLDC